jgi:hypothetical protein
MTSERATPTILVLRSLAPFDIRPVTSERATPTILVLRSLA